MGARCQLICSVPRCTNRPCCVDGFPPPSSPTLPEMTGPAKEADGLLIDGRLVNDDTAQPRRSPTFCAPTPSPSAGRRRRPACASASTSRRAKPSAAARSTRTSPPALRRIRCCIPTTKTSNPARAARPPRRPPGHTRMATPSLGIRIVARRAIASRRRLRAEEAHLPTRVPRCTRARVWSSPKPPPTCSRRSSSCSS